MSDVGKRLLDAANDAREGRVRMWSGDPPTDRGPIYGVAEKDLQHLTDTIEEQAALLREAGEEVSIADKRLASYGFSESYPTRVVLRALLTKLEARK